jgi:hypothetical protein
LGDALRIRRYRPGDASVPRRVFASSVSLRAERFSLASGFVIEVRQEVERAGLILRNARMRKVLTDAG